jgi:hypothetical protein
MIMTKANHFKDLKGNFTIPQQKNSTTVERVLGDLATIRTSLYNIHTNQINLNLMFCWCVVNSEWDFACEGQLLIRGWL